MNTDFLNIDELNLDKECINQPTRYFEFANKLANARNALDEARGDYDVTEAEISKRIRDNPAKFGLEAKTTETAIKAAVAVQPTLKVALQAVNEAKHRVDILQAAVTALDQRKRMLVLLVDMRGQDLYSGVKVSNDGKRAVEQEAKATTRKLGQRKRDDQEDE